MNFVKLHKFLQGVFFPELGLSNANAFIAIAVTCQTIVIRNKS